MVSGDNSLFFATGIDNSGLKSGAFNALGIVKGLGSKISKINPFAALAVGAVSAFAIVAKGAYDMVRDYEHAMKEVQTISDAAQKDFKGISSKVFDISKESIDTPKELAKAYYQVVSAGYDGAKGLELLKIASKAAIAGVTDTKTAVDGLTTILNSYKLGSEDTEKVSDALFNTVKLGKTTFSELAASISQVAPIAAASNIPINEILSTVASLTKQGVPTAQAMTQIRSAIVGLNESGRLDGTKTLQENMQALYDTFNGNQTTIQGEIGRIEGVQAVLGIAGRNAKSANEDLKSYNYTLGATEKASKEMLSSTENQWKIFRNRLKATTEDIGNVVLEMSNSIARSLNNALDSSESLREGVIKQRAEYNRLVRELDDVNTGLDRKKKILKLLKDSYPGYLKSLDIDKISNENLSKALNLVKANLEDINKLHERRIELSAYDDSVESAKRDNENLQNIYDDHLGYFKRKLKEIEDYAADPKNEIVLNFKTSDSPQDIFLSVEKSLGNNDIGFSKTASLTRNLGNALQNLVDIKPRLEETTKELEKQQKLLSNKEIKFGNEEGFKDVIEKINQINKLSSLKPFKSNYNRKEIVQALKLREAVLKTIASIKTISKEDVNKGGLSKFLESENLEIKEAAKKRQAFFAIKSTPDDTTYLESLEKKKDAYESYVNDVKALGKERADEINKDLLSQGKDYYTFLRNQLEQYKGFVSKEKAISEASANANLPGFSRGHDLKKVDVVVKPIAQVIEISDNDIGRLVRKLQDDLNDGLSGEGIILQIAKIAQSQTKEVDKINAIKKLKLEQLQKLETTLSRKAFAQRKKDILKQSKELTQQVFNNTNELLSKIPSEILDKSLQGTELSFQNLNAATLGQLGKLQDKLKEISLDSGQLLDLGLEKEQVAELIALLDGLKNNASENIDTAEATKIGDIFSEVGHVMSQAGDEITAAVGNMAIQLGSAIAVMGDESATGLQKAAGLVGLIIQAGKLTKQIGVDDYNKEINAQKEKNKSIAEQLDMEAKINEIRRERAEIERNSSAFLDSYYKDDFTASVEKQVESEEKLNKAMEALSKNGVFTAEGIGKRLLFGTKTENREFSFDDILQGKDIPSYFSTDPFTDGNVAASRFFDPLSIFGGHSDLNVSKDALKKLQGAFESTLSGMGKTSADMARFSSEEWLDFFTVLEDAGHIVDEGTQQMLGNAKEALQDYNDALEEMKGIISDFAGNLGDSLGDSLVSAFEDGTDAADSFMKSVNDVINKLFLNQLIDSQFRSYFDDLQKEMESSFSAGGDKSWIDDIKRFAEGVGPQMDAAVEAMRTFDEQMEEAGYDGFGNGKASGLAGSISAITEDTANILAGTLNSMRIDLANGLAIAEINSQYLLQITQNTSYNKHLESIDKNMSDLNSSFSNFESQGF